MRSTLKCAHATSSAVAEEARKRPSSAAAAAPSPRRHGEKGPACAITSVQIAVLRQRQPSLRPRSGEKGQQAPSPACSLQSCESASLPFAPRSGEKVVRQHRMRGRGSWGAIDVAAVRKRGFIGGHRRRSTKAPLIRGCRRTFSPSPRGEGTSMCFHQCAALHACDSASLPFAPRSGEKAQACANSCLHCCDRLDRISEARLQPGPAQGSSTCGRRLRSKSTRTRWPPAAVASRRAARRSAWQTHRRTSPSASAPGSDPLARNR